MKKNLILLLIVLATSSGLAFAGQEPKVISDIDSKKQTMDSFSEINSYTNNFFTSVITQQEKERLKKLKEESISKTDQVPGEGQMRGTLPPVKKIRLAIKNKGKKTQETSAQTTASKNQALLDCNTMEYFADRTELEANGNVVLFFPKNNSTIKADKMIYNQTSNLIKAFGKVVLISDGKELTGDYMQVDLNEENAFLEKPEGDIFQIQAKAKMGYMYGDKIIQEQGSLYIKKKMPINLRSDMFGPDLSTMYLANQDKALYKKDSHGEKFKIKTNDLIINSKDEHDTVTLKHAEIYFDEKKIGTIPSITVHTNKNQDYVEADYPELGTTTNLGFYAGPGFVFDTPKGSTVKLIPMFNYNAGKIGAGGIAKFKNATNKTDIAYGTAGEMFIVRGKQRLDDNLYLQYGSNAYMDDWFMGFRMPKYMAEVYYDDRVLNENFLGKNLDMMFSQRFAAGYMQDGDVGDGNIGALKSEGGIGTLRLKYMTEVSQTIYNFNCERFMQDASLKTIKNKDDILAARLEMVFQGAASLYGTGDTQMLARVGPRLHTQYKYWMQDVGYFLSGYNDNTPMPLFDKYMYGRSNAYVRETLRLTKYLTLSWFGSVNLTNDAWNGSLMQENSFFFSLGPDDIKLHVGYDTVRQQSFVTMALALDAKGSTIEYKRMEIKNPDTLGKQKNGKNNPNNTFAPTTQDDDSGIERADVIEIKNDNETI
ncbi:MAG TPA: hypothetical protein PLG15_04470 [Candidatus Gastranaerophilaceae bacterium]|nr:hypothetical protein [Candidatus Gastranaerophilaceae bacterium]HPT41621.1 hypothetical protein [Candidatus Gastranaerophilaceae bacterium]